jgi:hypothetical protein
MNVVRPYKQARLVLNEVQEGAGWDLCRAANTLKKQIAAAPAGVQRRTLMEYAALLALVRDDVQTNDLPYQYNMGTADALVAADVDFELYMTLATLAARDVTDATDARQLGTIDSYQHAAQLYAQAAETTEAAIGALCSIPPPRDRLGVPARERWLALVVPRGLTPAEAIAMLRARSQVLRCESAACQYAAILVAAQETPEFAPDAHQAGEFVARAFARVLHDLTRAGANLASSRLARYAEFMTALHRTRLTVALAAEDVQTAEAKVDAIALGRALRRLDAVAGMKCGVEAYRAVDAALGDQLKQYNSRLAALRARCDELAADTSGVYAATERTGALVEPIPLEPLDPAQLLADSASATPAGVPAPLSVARLRAAYETANPRFASFLGLRTQRARLLADIEPRGAPGVRSTGDMVMQFLATQLIDEGLSAGAHGVLARPAVVAELLTAAFQFGRLTERKLWTDFSFQMEDADASAGGTTQSPAARDSKEVNDALALGLAYFADLAKEMNLPTPRT